MEESASPMFAKRKRSIHSTNVLAGAGGSDDAHGAIRLDDCEKYAPIDYLISGHRQNGETWACPDCEATWIHICDEAEGCFWELKIK